MEAGSKELADALDEKIKDHVSALVAMCVRVDLTPETAGDGGASSSGAGLDAGDDTPAE